MKSLSDQTSSSRLDGQDSTMRSLDAALARARDLRDVSELLGDQRWDVTTSREIISFGMSSTSPQLGGSEIKMRLRPKT